MAKYEGCTARELLLLVLKCVDRDLNLVVSHFLLGMQCPRRKAVTDEM